MSRTVGILGASGYAGAELLRLLARHPELEVVWAAGETAAGKPVAERYPGLAAAWGSLAFSSLEEGLDKGAEVVFLALPHGRSAELAARVAAKAELAGARRVAVPGCYPTAALLALAPLVRAGVVEPDGLVVDAKSGVSGAGRALKDDYLFSQADENVSPYGAPTHRHTPEIEQELGRLAGCEVTLTFVPHLVPMTRGILATCYGRLAPGATGEDARACFEHAYGDEPFVDLLAPGRWPRTRAVATTNRAEVAVATDSRAGRAVASAAIDNLVKGAAGQAVQCANLALGLDETAGLELVPPGP